MSEKLEIDGFHFKTMKVLFEQLWLASDNCKLPIEHIWFVIYEVSKITNSHKSEIMKYLNFLIDRNYVKHLSDDPLTYVISETGKEIKSDIEILNLLNN